MKTPYKVFILCFFAVATYANFATASEGDIFYRHHDFGFGMLMGPFMMVLMLILAVGAIYFISRAVNNQSESKKEHNDTPLNILQKRYAAGEISKEEFDKILKDI